MNLLLNMRIVKHPIYVESYRGTRTFGINFHLNKFREFIAALAAMYREFLHARDAIFFPNCYNYVDCGGGPRSIITWLPLIRRSSTATWYYVK